MRYLRTIFFFIIFFLSGSIAQAQICITLDPPGTIPQTVCINSPINNITYTVVPAVTSVTSTGFPTGVTGVLSGNKYTISGTPVVSGTFEYELTTVGCVEKTKGTITVKDRPAPPIGTTPQNFCAISNPTVANLTATGSGILWYLNPSGGTPLATTTPLSTRTYHASQTVDGCESATRLAVFAVVNNPAAPEGPTPQSFCAINNPTIANLVVSGTEIKWYLSPAGGPALPSSTPLSSNIYYASQTISGCESSSRLAVTVTVNNPPAPTGSATQNFCIADNPTVASLTATGSGIKWYLVPSGGTALVTTTPLVTGNYYASQTVGSCESALRLAVSVTVTNPSAPTGASPQNFCQINSPTVASLVAIGSGIKWYLTATGGTALVTTTPLVTDIYYASQTFGSCESTLRLAVNVTVSNPAAPTGISPQIFCSAVNPTVANLAVTGTGILWYLTSTGGPSLAPTTPLVAGNYYASQTVGGCESVSRLAVAVTIIQTPVSNAGTGGSSCSLSFTLNAVAPTIGTGLWTQTSGPGTSVFTPNASTPNAVVTVSVYGTYVFTWTVVNNNCSSISTVTVNFFQQPVANAGTGGTECDLTFVMNAVPSIGTGLWTVDSGPGTAIFVPVASSPGANVTVSAYGTYSFRWTETNGICISSAVVTVNFYQRPVANAGTGGNSCNLNYPLRAVPSLGTGTWTMTGGSGTATFTPNANSPSVIAAVSEYGTKEFTWIEINGLCSDTSKITVNFYQQPSANAGSGGNNCGLEFNLRATPSVGVGTWTRDSGPGSASFSPDANNPAAKVTVSAYGNYVFRWTEVNGTCTSSATVPVTFIQQPSAIAGKGGEECDLDFALNAVPGTGTGTWSKVSGPGNAVFSPNPNQYNAVVTVSQFGSYDFAWTEVNSLCTSNDIIRVGFHDIPSVDAGDDVLLCKGKGIQLNASGTGSFLWSPASPLNNPNIYNPVASPDATTEFTVTLTDQWGCKNSDKVNVEVREQPLADAGPDQVLQFIFETNLQAVAPGSNQTGEWTLFEGKGDISDVHDPSASVSDLSLEVNSFIWTVTNQACPVSSDTVEIVVQNLIIPTLITPNLDGNNEFFIIEGIESLGKTSLVVFSRWGARVYENNEYDNSWNGVDDKENPLPEDTYFYILRPETTKTIKGYVVIRR